LGRCFARLKSLVVLPIRHIKMILKFFKNKRERSENSPDSNKRSSQSVEYQGVTITPTPKKVAGGWTTEGNIHWKTGDGVSLEHFIRAETHVDQEQAFNHIVTKAKRIIDERRST